MDVKRLLLLAILTGALGACSRTGSKTEEMTESFSSVKCQGKSAIMNEFIVQWEDGSFTVEQGADPETFREEFVRPREHEIRFVQINQRVYQLNPVELQSEISHQAGFYPDDWGQARVEASAAWSAGYKGQGVKVGVIDSQVNIQHPQLNPRIAVNYAEIAGNGIDDDGNGVVDDVYGANFMSVGTNTGKNEHGSHVAGVIAADPRRGWMSGVAPEAQIVAAGFLDDSGSGTLGDAVKAMDYAVARGAKILNASWGGSGCDLALANAFAKYSSQGVLLVVAAGNSGIDIDSYGFFPAAFEYATQITVGASGFSDIMPTWSNNGFTHVHLTAPGEDIVSTGLGNSYLSMDGTSMATPFVAGAAAVLWSAKPQATATQIKQALLSSVDVISGKQSKTLTRGRLNVRKALSELQRIVP